MILKSLLLLVPVSLLPEYLVHAGSVWIFATAILAIIPLADLIRQGTALYALFAFAFFFVTPGVGLVREK
jgi:Ca2+:H+ antiporter